MLKNGMKICLAAALCLLLLWGAVCPAQADETDAGDETTTSEENTTTTFEEIATTTGAEPVPVYIAIILDGSDVVLQVTDGEGDPVPQAPLALSLDGEVHAIVTNGAGSARYKPIRMPGQIACAMAAFTGKKEYAAAAASVVLQSAETTTETETASSSRPTTTLGPVITWTVDDPGAGDVTVTEIVTVSTGAGEEIPASAATQQENGFPRGIALYLIILGAVLLAGAALTVYFFLAYAPRQKAEQKAPEQKKRSSRQ